MGLVVPSAGLAQVVTPALTGTLASVDLNLYRSAGTQGLSVRITNVSSGVPTGPDLASAFIPNSDIPFVRTWISVTFAAEVSVTAGREFAIVVSTANTTNDYAWVSNQAATYPGGPASVNIASTWTTFANTAMDFRTYVTTPSDSGEAPPPVLQQFGMPATDTCDAAASADLNWGGAVSGGWGNSWAAWMNGGLGGPVCTRTLVYSTSRGRWVAQ